MKRIIILLLIIGLIRSECSASWKGEMFCGIIGLFGAFALDLKSGEYEESKRSARREQFAADWHYKWKQSNADYYTVEAQKEFTKHGDTKYYRYCIYWALVDGQEAKQAKKSWLGFAKNIDISDDQANFFRNASYVVGVASACLLIKSMLSYQKEHKENKKKKRKYENIEIKYDAKINGGVMSYSF